MKIHAIRGENIASLAGSFEIEMEKGILGQSGLFAITGPTGAGKSTLLDAMCLALYDRIPRFDLARSIEVGRSGDSYREKANDVKTIMHKGASSCFAEVDFLGSEACLYRARWFARRARNRADGRLQGQTLSLINLDTGKEWTGKKTDVLQSIERRVGLTFDQFRRSVLLAQGDFAAFLKSNDGERAELLEKMTGSEIYAEISRQTFERNKEEQQVLKELEIRKTGIGFLDDDRKKEIEGTLRELTKKQSEFGKKQIRLQGILSLESDRKEKNRYYIESNERVEKEEIKQGNLYSLLKTSEDKFLSGKSLLHEAEKQAGEIKPDIDKAREYDVLLQKSSLQLSELNRRYQKTFLRVETAGKQVRENEIVQKTLLDDRDKKRKWLKEHHNLERLSPLLNRILLDIDSFRSSGKQLEKADLDKKHFEKQKGTLKVEIGKQEVLDQQYEKTIKTINLDVEKAEKETDTLSREVLIKERNQLFAEKESLGVIEKTAVQMIKKDHLEKECSGNLEKAEKEVTDCKGQILNLQKKLPEMTGRIKELETSLRDAELAAGLEDKRKMLTLGKPCPLCGSEDHPWTDGSPLPELISGFRVRLEENKQQHAELLKKLSVEMEREKRLVQDIKGYHKSLESIRLELIELNKTMTACLSDLSDVYKNRLNHEIPLDELPGLCHFFLTGIQKKESLNKQAEKHLNVLEETYKGLTRKREKIIQQADKNRETIQGNRTKLVECVEKLNQALIVFEKESQIRNDAYARILKEFPEHRTLERELVENPSGFSKSLRSDVRHYTETMDYITEIETRLNTVSHELTRLSEEVTQLGKGTSEALSNLKEEKKTQETLLTERNQLLHGKTVGDMEKIITETVENAARALEKKRKAKEKIKADLSESKGTHKTAVADLKKWNREFTAADRKLKHELKKNKLQDDKDRIDTIMSGLKGDIDDLVHEIQKHHVILENDIENLKKAKNFQKEIEEKTAKAQVWSQINLLIGSADGSKFRKFAQGLTLDLLIGYSNRYLTDLSRRYVLERVPGQNLEIQIRDREMGDEIRSSSSLSGGESFLVSLALALGLSGMTSATVSVESLFVDEGFGTLDPETLETALAALDNLQATGRKVGVISHVQGLAEHIGAQVLVKKVGSGRSKVNIYNS